MLAIISPQVGIPICLVMVFIGILLLIRAYKKQSVKQVVRELLSKGIYTDVPVNILRILYHDREKLVAGFSDEVASNQDKLVLHQLDLRKIVKLEQRKVRIYGSDNIRDEGYWILTELGKDVIKYLQANPQVLDKEGAVSK